MKPDSFGWTPEGSMVYFYQPELEPELEPVPDIRDVIRKKAKILIIIKIIIILMFMGLIGGYIGYCKLNPNFLDYMGYLPVFAILALVVLISISIPMDIYYISFVKLL